MGLRKGLERIVAPDSRASALSSTVRTSIRPIRPDAPVTTIPGLSMSARPFCQPLP